MDIYKNLDWSEVERVKISPSSRITKKNDLNHIRSTENISVVFQLKGDIKGNIDCHLCLDNKDVTEADRNYLYPFFTESMNILIGRLLSTDKLLSSSQVKLSPPKCTLYSKIVDSRLVTKLMVYELTINDFEFDVVLNMNISIAS